MSNVFYPPHNISKRDFTKKSIFLAGTIDMGNSTDWQTETIELIHYRYGPFHFNIINPRRKDWDSSWVQEYQNPNFYQQVNWELSALEAADVIIVYFAAGSQSPITLMELGLYAGSGKCLVVCEDGFWRKGNVEIVCDNYDIPMYETIKDVVNTLNII
jgi:hypothetical protein